MKEEITRIMKLVQEGKLSPEDAAELIEAFNDAPETDESGEEEASGEGEAGVSESSKEDPFSKFLGNVERITKDVSNSINWKDIAGQVRSGVHRGAEAVKSAMDEASKGKGPFFNVVFGHQSTRTFDLPLDVPEGKILRLEGISGDIQVEGGHDIGSVNIEATFRAYNDEEAEKAAERYLPVLEESDKYVTLRHGDGENLTANVVVKVRSGVNLEIKVTSGEVKVSKTNGSVRVASTSGDVSVSDAVDNLEVSVVSGDVKISDCKTSSVTVESKSGDLDISGVEGTVSFRTSSGDISATKCGASALNVEAASGDVNLDITRAVDGDVTVKTVSGDIRVHVTGNSDAKVKLSTLRGSVSSTIDLEDQSQEKLSIAGSLGDGAGSIELSAVNGDVYLGLRDSNGD